MENNIEILENIMRPYFEKKEELKANEEQKKNEYKELFYKIEDNKAELNFLEFRLQKLLDNKEEEIAMLSRSNSSYIYVENIRKEIDSAYKEREESLRNEIDSAYRKKEELLIKQEEMLQNPNKFHRVDIKEIINIKQDLRPKLYQERKRLDLELRQQQSNYDILMINLSNLKI